MLDKADVWDHIVEVNAGNAERLRGHDKVKLLSYKGWAPEGEHAESPDAIRNQLPKPGDMIFCKDPRLLAKLLQRPMTDPKPLPPGLRAVWTPGGMLIYP